MKHIAFTLFTILVLALAYFIAGKLSLLLAIPPGFATPVWPAAGIALAAVLVFGYRCLPGVFLGSFATNLLIASNAGAPLTTLTPYLVGGGIAFGATLQAALGAWLVKHIITFPATLARPRTLAALFVRGGLISCLVNSITGPLTLLIAGIIPHSIYFISVFTWWVGDVIGVVLFSPMLLLLANKQASTMRKAIVGFPILVFACITIFIFSDAREDQLNDRQRSFDLIAKDIATELEKNIDIYLNILKANERFINASEYVSSKEFDIFTSGFLKQYPSIYSLSWNPKITHDMRTAHEAEIREQGFQDYTIKDRFGTGKIEPAAERDVYFPVALLSPYTKNAAAHGFDTYSWDKVEGNMRKYALDQARDIGKPVMTGRISIVQAEHQYGLIIYNPVYSTTLQDHSVRTHREQLIGYTAGVFIIPNMLSPIATLTKQAGIEFTLRDLGATEDRQLLYDSRTPNHQATELPIPIEKGALHSSVRFDLAGHPLVLDFIQNANSFVADQGWSLWYLLIGGLLLSAMFGAFLMIISASTESIQNEVKKVQEKVREEEAVSAFFILTNVSACASVLLGLVVLVGWYVHSPTLIQIHPTFAPMQYNTALGFLLSGVGIAVLAWGRIKLALVCGLILSAVSILTLIQYIFGSDFGIDQFLMEHYVVTKTSHPGRMAPNTALCFILVGITLIIPFFVQKHVVLRALGSLILLLGVASFVGYVVELETVYGWMDLTRMAVHTAASFTLLGIGIIAYSQFKRSSRLVSGSAFWFSSLAITVAMLFSIAIWMNFKNQEREIIYTTLEDELRIIATSISNEINKTAVALRRMANRWETAGGTPKAQWEADAKHYVDDFITLTTIEWIDNTFHVRWIEPLEGNENALGLNITFNEERQKALKGAAERHTTTLTPPIDLIQGYRAILSYAPIHINHNFEGFILGIHKIDTLFEHILSSESLQDLNIQITDGEKKLFSHGQDNSYREAWHANKTISLLGRDWDITLWPNASFLKKHKTIIANIVLLGGFLFSLLVGLSVYTSVLSNQRSVLLRKSALALRESEGKLSAILETAPDGILSVNHQGIIQSVNETVTQIFGYQEAELLGHSIEILVPETLRAQHAHDVSHYTKDGKSKIMASGREVAGIHKDGTMIPLEVGLSRSLLPNNAIQVVATIRDITERKQAEDTLKELTKRLGLILDNVGEGIYGLDLNGYTTFANRAAEKMLGYTVDDMLHKVQHELIHHHYPDGTVYPKEECNIYKAYRDGKSHSTDQEVFWRKDGTSVPVEYTSQPIKDDNNVITGAVVVFRDITDRRSAEAERERLIEKLNESNEELSRFAYVASHDLQEPLRMVRNFTQLLEKKYSDKLDDDARKYIEISSTSAERMQYLVQDLLEYARINEEAEVIEEIDSDSTLTLVKENLNERITQTKAVITSDSLPIIYGNPIRFSRLLQNLIGNAIKYQNPDNTPTIHVGAEEQKTQWKFCIKDNGIGMKPEYCKKIFLPFQRLHHKDQYSGTGIGLAICAKIIEQMGGRIWVKSKPDKGSEFYFTVPKRAKPHTHKEAV